ncbi:MAG: hypothetical protein ACLFSU_05110 [Acholeplasmataceae bacterium]
MNKSRVFVLIFVLILSLTLMSGCGLIEEVESIRIVGSTEVKAGEEYSYRAVITPERLASLRVDWSVRADDGEATINENGLLVAREAGTITVIAELRGVEATLDVVITERVQSVTIEGPDEVTVEDVTTYDISISPEDATYRRAVWTVLSDSGVAAITEDGELTAFSPGRITIRVSVDGVIGRKEVDIIEQQE